ncbi:hypothetical protein L596_006351 [Steinernema carpocapsae]|uniref:Uncharacterized protein n=1 Tax=Steinernema carpocapsae TaxID=34508 RepID=A0A4U8V3P2_STECR|nr:hypothetical protein L596_006351 [Steinernema carpocapsae]
MNARTSVQRVVPVCRMEARELVVLLLVFPSAGDAGCQPDDGVVSLLLSRRLAIGGAMVAVVGVSGALGSLCLFWCYNGAGDVRGNL